MNTFDLSGKVALVTGGNSGIGLAMAMGLARAGAAVAVAGRRDDRNAAAVRGIEQIGGRAIAVRVDVRDAASCRRMVDETAERLDGFHVLINNAGTNIRKQPQDYTLDEWHLVLDTNLTSAFVASQTAYAHMSRAGGGKIINIGSIMSLFGTPFVAPYGASKGGIVQLTRALACAWAKDNIQVNAVLPGWVDTPLTRGARDDIPGLYERVLTRTPAGRWGQPEDLAGIAGFLASSASDFVTGAAIPVDGGYSSLG